MNDRNLEQIVSTCVDCYLGGEWTLDDCLARYPEHAALIRKYLDLSDALSDLALPHPSKAALSFGERLVLGELDRVLESKRAGSSLRGFAGRVGRLLVTSRLATATAAVLIAMLLGSGVTLAASVSSPTSPLYGYKLTLDQVRIELAPEDRKADVYIDVAERRLQEMEQVARSDGGKGIDRISADYRQMLDHGLEKLRSLSERDAADVRRRFAESRSNFENRLEGHRRRLESMAPSGQPELREVVTITLQNAEANLSKLPTAPPEVHLAEAESPAPAANPPQSPVTATPAATAVPEASPTTTPVGALTAASGDEPPSDDRDEPAAGSGSTDATAQTSPKPTDVPAPEAEVSPVPPAPAATKAPPAETVELEGVVTAMGRSALVVNGRQVVLDASVVPNPIVRGKPAVGINVRIRGLLAADGTIFLVELQTLSGDAAATPSPASTEATTTPEPTPTATPTPEGTTTPEPEFEISGTITAVTDSLIEVDGRTIDIGELLDASALSLESLQLGATVNVKGYVQPGNILTATEITIDTSQSESDAEEPSTTPTPESTSSESTVTPTPDANRVTIEGVLTVVEEQSIEIDGQTIIVVVEGESATAIEGIVEAGASAAVSALLQEDGTLVAESITILSPPATPTATPTIVEEEEEEEAASQDGGDNQESTDGS